MSETKQLKRRFALAVFALLGAFAVAAATTVAWYIFTASARTTKLHMAAGTGVSLQISDAEDGAFSSAVALERFQGYLTPVSTDRIAGGFQKVKGFIHSSGDGSLLANLFQKSLDAEHDYYKTSLYFRTNAEELSIYLADIGFRDSDESIPISSAIRVGVVIPSTSQEYIFAISDKKNPQRQYNTQSGAEGCVLDSTKTDGSTVEFTPLTKDNYCNYNAETGEISLKPGSKALGKVTGVGDSYGPALKMDVYIWLEGCDEDCTQSISNSTLSDIALSFVGVADANGGV